MLHFKKKSKNSVIIKEKKYHLFKLSNKLTATQSQSHISERDDTYQKAIAKVYDVTDEKFWAYLEKLKNYKQSNLLELKKNSIKSYANENFTFSFH